jgi:TonB-dependent starch-binding outer membrane protein SusC
MYLNALLKSCSNKSRFLTKPIRIMKLISIFLLATCLQVSAETYAQKVSLNESNIPLQKVFGEIRKQTGYQFFYADEVIASAKKVTINIKKASIEEALDICFKDQLLSYTISENTIVVKRKAATLNVNATPTVTKTISSDIEIKGKITDEKGAPLSGVSILVKGTKIGTQTDAVGEFNLSVPNNAVTIIVSSIGYETKQVAIIGNTIEVSLTPKSNKLDELLINVGYGTQKKSVITGAISRVSAKDLENVPNGRLEQALQGRVSGITIATNSGQPGSASTIRVRGITTFGDGGNNPLWVVDGVVVDAGGIGYLNQSDIESIEVLKDATSAAIYGTRAATGVIIVTTKKGKAGKLQINYNVFVGTSAPAKKLNLLNATQYATLTNEKSVAGGGTVIFPNASSLGTGTDWQDAIFNKNARRYTHELSLSGGTERSTFYLSMGIQNQQGIVGKEISNFNRKNIRLNSTHKISNVFTFGQTLGYAHQKESGIGNTNSEFGGLLSSAINLDPTTSLVVTDPAIANAAPYSVNPVLRDASGNPYGISSVVGQEMTNPLAYIQTRLGAYGWSDNIVGNAYLEAAVTKDIKIKSVVGAKLSYYGGQGFTPLYYLSATSKTSQNSFGKSSNNGFNWNIENTITYSKKINNHNFTILAGQGAYVENIGGGSSVTFFNLPISSYKDASFNFDIPASNKVSAAYDFNQHKLSSLFGRLNYNYNEKYLFTGIIRRDGSSRFGPNNKYAMFPSFSAGWVVTKENFWKQNKYVNQLKIRGGYGKVGNDNIGDFGYLSLVNGGYNYTLGNAGGIVTGYAPKTLDNPDLKWEETSQINVGLEARVLNAINITVDYFKKKTTGILREITIPGYVGVSSKPVGNVADMENSGVEVELNYRKKIGAVNFSTTGNIATLKNKVTYVAPDADYQFGDAGFQSFGGGVTRTAVGQSYNSFYGFQTAGIFQNQAEVNAYTNKTGGLIQPTAKPGDFRWEDSNGDGKINDDDKIFLGNSIPKYTFGLTLNAEFKGFDVMVFAQGAAGNKIFQGLRRLDIGNANYQTKALGRWTGEGTSNEFPRLTTNDANGNFGKMSNFYLEKGDYVRIKLVQIGYTIPNNKVFNKIGASKLRFYVTGENLFTITQYTGYDPEIGGGVFGIDKGFYPQARSIIFGAQVQF